MSYNPEQFLVEALGTLSSSSRYNAWLASQLVPHLSGTVLDVGSGFGDVASFFDTPSTERILLTDTAKPMVAHLKARFAGQTKFDVRLMDASAPDAFQLFKAEMPDWITLVNVLEHIDDDAGALLKMRGILKPNGRIGVIVPALPQLYGSLDQVSGHYRRYTPKMLTETFHRAGLKIGRLYYMNFLGVLTWFLAGRILRQQKFNPRTCHILDRIVPALRFLESGPKPFWGQTLVAITAPISGMRLPG